MQSEVLLGTCWEHIGNLKNILIMNCELERNTIRTSWEHITKVEIQKIQHFALSQKKVF
jgi:hypothetical protein